MSKTFPLAEGESSREYSIISGRYRVYDVDIGAFGVLVALPCGALMK
jgi:hypothetical protein